MLAETFVKVGDYLFNVSEIRNMYVNRDAIHFDFKNPRNDGDWISISYSTNKEAKKRFEEIVEEIIKKA